MVEEDPHQIPEPLVKPVYAECFVDADHGLNVVTRRLHSKIFLFVNNALIKSFSKRQNTVKSSTFGPELVALRISRDMIVEIIIKLKMFGVPLARPENLFCDNNWVVKNTSIPESTLSKKHNAINYHCVHESASAGIMCVGKEDMEMNLANPLTKFLPYSLKQELIGFIIYNCLVRIGVAVSGRYSFG